MEVEKEMIGGLMKTTSRFAVASAAGLFMGGIALTPAQAADLGGDCCADLEERVAELEATTVRKGTRVMSVKLSGQVNRAVMWWDDGDESNTYVVDNDHSGSRFRITGDANWRPGWKIGFAMEWEFQDDASNSVNATNDDLGQGSFTVRQQHWWVKSDKLGKLSVGQLSSASDATSEVNLSGATVVSGTLLNLTGASFALVNNQKQPTPTGFRDPRLTYGSMNPGNIDGLSRLDGVRYDSPTFGGFTLSAGWYEDDMWDVALRFAKQWNSVLVAAAIGYADNREGTNAAFCSAASAVSTTNGGGDDADCHQVNGSISILHQPTGLFVTFAAGRQTDDNRTNAALLNTAVSGNGDLNGVSIDDDASFWYVNAGIYRRFNEWGKTSIGVEYYDGECGYGGCGNNFTEDSGVFGDAVNGNEYLGGTESQTWGVFLVQKIDNAATEFYLAYHHTEFDADLVGPGALNAEANNSGAEDLDTVLAGARVKF
jgi:hypothetical protein